MSTIGERIKEVRKSFKLNQEQFAKELGISRGHISNLEKGKDNPSSALIKLLCTKFNVDEKWMLENVGNMVPDYNILTSEGAISKYNSVRVSFERQLRGASDENLRYLVMAFAYLTSLLIPAKLEGDDATAYLKSICKAIDQMERLIVDASLGGACKPSTKDAKGWLEYKDWCYTTLGNIEKNIKDATNLHLSKYGEEMKL